VLEVGIPIDIADEDKLEYRRIRLICKLLLILKDYWGYTLKQTTDVFKENDVYAFIRQHYDYYSMVSVTQAVMDICDCLDLPSGSWDNVEESK